MAFAQAFQSAVMRFRPFKMTIDGNVFVARKSLLGKITLTVNGYTVGEQSFNSSIKFAIMEAK